jgi:hypothetical protein
MAKKLTTEEEIQEQEIQGAPYDPWKDMRRVFIPKMSRGEQDTLEVGVNDKTYFVPKEQFVEVPAPVWEVVSEMLKRRKIMETEAKKHSGERQVHI